MAANFGFTQVEIFWMEIGVRQANYFGGRVQKCVGFLKGQIHGQYSQIHPHIACPCDLYGAMEEDFAKIEKVAGDCSRFGFVMEDFGEDYSFRIVCLEVTPLNQNHFGVYNYGQRLQEQIGLWVLKIFVNQLLQSAIFLQVVDFGSPCQNGDCFTDRLRKLANQ